MLYELFLCCQAGLNTLHGLMHFSYSDFPLSKLSASFRASTQYALSTICSLARVEQAEIAQLVDRCALLVKLSHFLIFHCVSFYFALDFAEPLYLFGVDEVDVVLDPFVFGLQRHCVHKLAPASPVDLWINHIETELLVEAKIRLTVLQLVDVEGLAGQFRVSTLADQKLYQVLMLFV